MAKLWKGVSVYMQSAIGSVVNISAISKASPGVVTTATAHGFANGDYVCISVQGMRQVHDRIFRVAGQTSTTFQIEGEDTTNFDTFTSGTVQKVTFGTTISTATTISNSGGDFNMVDTTTIHDTQSQQMPGLPSAATYNMDHLWSASDAGLKAMKAASDLQAKRAFMFNISGDVVVFNGYVGCNMAPGGSAQDKVMTKSVFTMNGTPTYY